MLATPSCDGGGESGAPATPTASTGPGGGAGGQGATGGVGGANTECMVDSDCGAGQACVSGACCAAEAACASACCNSGEVCLFDQCVTPGKACHTNSDCADGEYCETALGDDGGGGGGVGGEGCTEPLPLEGKCLGLPPVCDQNGQPPGCVEACEYHPPPGVLTAEARWTWGPVAKDFPDHTDVWSTPTVGRLHDANCDGKVDELDPPNVVFVSGKAIDVSTGKGTCCHCTGGAQSACLTGVLRVLDGRTGAEVWSLDKPEAASKGFAGVSVAIGDVDGDARMDIFAVTGEGRIVLVDAKGNVLRTSDKPIPGNGNSTFGWGGGLAVADIDHDGFPEVAYGATVFTTTNGAITLLWTGTGGIGGGTVYEALSTFVDLDEAPDGHLELLGGNTAYKSDGTVLWNRSDLPDGFPGIGDFDADGKPEAVLVANGQVWLLEGATGATKLGPAALPGTGFGGPPTVADFDGDGAPEIGVARANFYSMLKPDFAGGKLTVVWKTPNHDLSSSVTGSSVFDFEGDGKAEVVYGDECFLWVYDGQTGAVRFATPHTSFTGTEASVVADVDGDGHAEILVVSNGADPSAEGWGCDVAPWNEATADHPAWVPPANGPAYRGLALFGDKANSWVGTRTLWNQHTYHVSNVCDDRDSACDAPNVYGTIPKDEKKNWTVPWLNNFRQNVQDEGIFNAPDAIVTASVECVDPVVVHVSVRNVGLASLPAGVPVGIFKQTGGGDVQVGSAATTHFLFAGQTEKLASTIDPGSGTTSDVYVAKILVDPVAPAFHQCREDNDESMPVSASCVR